MKDKSLEERWNIALDAYPIVKSVAKEWANRVNDPDVYEDLVQDLVIHLVETLDLSKVTKDANNYIRSACWKKAHTILLNSEAKANRSNLSLEMLVEEGVQVTDTQQVVRPKVRRSRKVGDQDFLTDQDPGDVDG